MELAELPVLVRAAVAGPELGQGAVGPARVVVTARDVEAEAGLDAGDRAVRVQAPLLVGAAVAGPEGHLAGLGGAGVQAWFAPPLQSQISTAVPGAVWLLKTSRQRLATAVTSVLVTPTLVPLPGETRAPGAGPGALIEPLVVVTTFDQRLVSL